MRDLFFSLMLVLGALTGHAATFYLAPNGNDTGGDGSRGNPWRTTTRAFAQGGGHTYVFLDGNYDYPGGTIDNPPSGAPGQPTVVKAQNDGKAVIDGRGAQSAIVVFSNPASGAPRKYIVIEGFSARHSGERPVVQVSSQDGTPVSAQTSDITIRRVGAKGEAMSSNNNVWEISRTKDSLFEDIWGWGYGRYVVDVYGCTRVTVRRGVFRWDGWGQNASKPGDPKFCVGIYDTHDSLFENLLLLDAAPTALGGDKGAIYLPGNSNGNTAPYNDTDGNKFYGLILLNNIGHGIGVEGGSGGTNDNNLFTDVVIWGNSGHGITVPRKASNTTFNHATIGQNGHGTYFGGGDSGVSSTKLLNSLIVRNRQDGVNGAAGCSHNNAYGNGSNYSGGAASGPGSLSSDPGLSHIVALSANSPGKGAALDGRDVGAKVVKLSVNGELTEKNLWPWPQEDRIREDMCAGETRGFCASASLTDYVWGQLGHPFPGGLTEVVSDPKSDSKSDSGSETPLPPVANPPVGLKEEPLRPEVKPNTSDNPKEPEKPLDKPPLEPTVSPEKSIGGDPWRPVQKFIAPDKPGQNKAQFGDDAVEVEINDASGQTIFHQTKSGSSNIVWDGKDESGRSVESGIYISRIKGSAGNVVHHPIAIVK